jgi:hypothetical protein
MGTSDADAAIERVLEAERAIKREVGECRRQALEILTEARSSARSIARQADRRINRIHTLCDASIQRALAEIATESATLSGRPELTPILRERLDSALRRLVDELLGGEP